MEDFLCDKCGECCKHCNTIPEMKDYDVGNGYCKYLTSNNLCSIYDKRPNICRGEFIHSTYFKEMSHGEFIDLKIKCCNKLKKVYK